MTAFQKCPSCSRAGPETGNCGSTITCPIKEGAGSVPVEATDVVLQCEPCGITRVISTDRLVHGKGLTDVISCQNPADCQCKPTIAGVPEPLAAKELPSRKPAASKMVAAKDAQG